MQSTASYLAQEELERLGGLDFDDTQLSIGWHPAVRRDDGVRPNDHWSRWYEVAAVSRRSTISSASPHRDLGQRRRTCDRAVHVIVRP